MFLTTDPALVSNKPKLEIFRGREGLRLIESAWKTLVQRLDTPRFFHLHEVCASYSQTLLDSTTEQLFCLMYNGRRPEALFPLIPKIEIGYGFTLKVLELPCHQHLPLSDGLFVQADKNGLLLHEFIRQLGKYVKWDVLRFPQLLNDSPLFSTLQSHPPRQIISVPTAPCDYLPCVPVQELQGRISKNFRHNLRKARNKLEALPNVEWVTARSLDELKRAFVDFLTVEASGWKGVAGTAILANEQTRQFYEMLIETLAPQNKCEINLLKTNGRTIAGQFCLITETTSYVLKIGYDEEFSAVAPGQMLLAEVINRYAQEGNIQFINLITNAEWHERWKPHQLSTWAVSIFNTTPVGFAAFGVMKARAAYQVTVHEHLRRQIRALLSGLWWS